MQKGTIQQGNGKSTRLHSTLTRNESLHTKLAQRQLLLLKLLLLQLLLLHGRQLLLRLLLREPEGTNGSTY